MTQHTSQYLHDTSKYESVPCAVDRIGTQTPGKPFISIPLDDDVRKGYRDISFDVFARAVNRCSWWLKQELGQSQSFESLSYCGPQDLRYLVLILASVKTGHNILLCAPFTSAKDYLSLLQTTHCKVFLHSADPLPLARSVLQNRKMDTLIVPPLDDWLSDLATPLFQYLKSLSEAWEDPFAMIVSSGSTGVPKPIQLTHGSVATVARYQEIPKDCPTLFHLWSGLRVLLTPPLSLGVGVFCMLSTNIYFDWTIVLPPPLTLTAELLDSIHEHANVQVSASLPTIYPDLATNNAYLKNLSRLQYVAYTGGPCPSEVGQTIASETTLTTLLGSSETGPIPTDVTDAEDWEYTKFSSSLPHRLKHIYGDLYELVIIREEASSWNTDTQNMQPVFCTFPNLAEFRTKDLYSKHPAKDNVWLYRGRRDDLIELLGSSSSSPELMFPIPIEKKVASHPAIKFALVYGTGRSQPALLVEPCEPFPDSEYASRSKQLIEDVVWPRVREANQGYHAHSRILQDMIQVTKPGKPMSLTTKQYLSRKKTTELYQPDLDLLYNDISSAK